jgi:hypothetical protein
MQTLICLRALQVMTSTCMCGPSRIRQTEAFYTSDMDLEASSKGCCPVLYTTAEFVEFRVAT